MVLFGAGALASAAVLVELPVLRFLLGGGFAESSSEDSVLAKKSDGGLMSGIVAVEQGELIEGDDQNVGPLSCVNCLRDTGGNQGPCV